MMYVAGEGEEEGVIWEESQKTSGYHVTADLWSPSMCGPLSRGHNLS